MYVRMISYRLMPDIGKDRVTDAYDEIVEVLESQNGFQGSALLFDEEAQTAILLTYWTDDECAGRAGESLLPTLFERSPELSDQPPEITGYHVLDHQFQAG